MNPVPLWGMIAMVLLATGLIVLSTRLDGDLRHQVLAAGLFVLAGAFFFWFILGFLSLLLGSLDSGDNGGGFGRGGFSGGGFGGGGFSGGGGASGSW